jgi:DivIVA domain-containing protein
MPEERLMSISSSSHLTPDDVARHSFGTVRRGFDPNEVRAYLESLAASLRGIGERERQLLDELSDAEYRASHPVLDEATLTAALGTETARVLHSAHEVAAEMLAKSEAEANRLLTEGREEIEQSRAHTEARLAEKSDAIETAAAELQERIEQQSAATMERSRREADAMLDQARETCRAMVEEAQGLRARVLADLSKRRKVLHVQIEQLRAGREQLAETVHDVRRSVDTIATELFAAEDNARLAAEAAGREALDRVDTATPEELAAQLLADEHESVVAIETGTDVPIEAVAPVGEPIAVEGDAPSEAEAEAPGALGAEGASEAPSGSSEFYDQLEVRGPEGVQIIGAVVAGAEAGEAQPTVPEETLEESPGPEEVDALFAKLRAARQTEEPPEAVPEPVPESVPDAVAETAEPDPVDPAPPKPAPKAASKSGGKSAPKSGGKSPAKSAVPPAPPEVAVSEQTGEASEPPEDDEDDGPPEERSPQAIRRDELIDPVVTTLSRRLKRTLQDSQNELLDSLRSNGSRWSTDLLPDETEHLDSFSTAALPALEQAAAAGVSFSGLRGATGPKTDVLLGIAHDLALAVVGPLRRRLAGGDGLDGADESMVAEHVGSAFREWKGERIERLAGDHVVAAFSAGTIAAAEGASPSPLEWVAVSDSGDNPCPDCEDNGLSGSLAPGEEYPTGHRHPPAHSGCRCLLVVSAT